LEDRPVGEENLRTLINPDSDVLTGLAAMHHAELPASRVSRLGLPYTTEFYRFGASSCDESVIAVLADDGPAVGGAFVSFNPAGLTSRLARHTRLIGALIRNPVLAGTLLTYEFISLGKRDELNPENDPELLAVFVSADWRGRGIGQVLLRAVEAATRERKLSRYIIRTEDAPTNRAISFYQREGFETQRTVNVCGLPFRIMMKHL
jgi:GNAT superfamily N-acetyltransferase